MTELSLAELEAERDRLFARLAAAAARSLGCAEASSQWEAICNHCHNQTPAA
jgi:hypothetical protein